MALNFENNVSTVTYTDLSAAILAEMSVIRGEAEFASNGALVVHTGDRTGRSPGDRFIVRDSITSDSVEWGSNNQPISPEIFDKLWERVLAHLNERETFVTELHVGADPDHYLPIEVKTEYAWHALFGRALFITPEIFNPKSRDIWQIVNAPRFICDPNRDGTNSDATVMIDFTNRRVVLAGLKYAGEMKK